MSAADRTQYLAEGLGMAFEIRNTVPVMSQFLVRRQSGAGFAG